MAEGDVEVLSVNVGENVKANEAFGEMDRQMKALKGVAGTLHVTRREDIGRIGDAAYNLSEQTGLPVIIVVRAIKI